jgi:polyisoprenoid-binding protein YceI
LTLIGLTRPLTLTATWNKSGDYPIGRNAYAIGVSARGVLAREDFGMDYALDNGWVGNEVEILIEFEALRQ